MTRKVEVEVEVVVLLPVTVNLFLMIRADEGANIDTVVKRFVKYGEMEAKKADVETVCVESCISYDQDEFDSIDNYIEDQAQSGLLRAKLVKADVVSSR